MDSQQFERIYRDSDSKDIPTKCLMDQRQVSDAEFIPLLAQWRRWQRDSTDMPELLKLVGGQLYADPTHSLYELIQNADDNDYPEGCTPSLCLEVQEDGAVLRNNELGFHRDHILALTSGGRSSKTLRGSSFIGEKGIGFKSIFGVFESVEVHSGEFAFSLRADTMTVPAPLRSAGEPGTLILLKDPKTVWHDVRAAVNAWTPDHLSFMLFLQRLHELRICRPAGELRIRKYHRGDRRVELDGFDRPATYYVYRHSFPMPRDTFAARYSENEHALLGENTLEREIVLAVPLDHTLQAKDPTLFAYLPVTGQCSGLPMLLQFDFKTNTSRETIAVSNAWNEAAMKHLWTAYEGLLKSWSQDSELVDRIPELLPPVGADGKFQMDSHAPSSITAALSLVNCDLDLLPLLRSPLGGLHTPFSMRTCGPALREALEPLCAEADAIQFVRLDVQEKHGRTLGAMGVQPLASSEVLDLLKRWQPGAILQDLHRDGARRAWLLVLAEAFPAQSPESSELAKLQLFPFRERDRIIFRPVSEPNIEVVYRRETAGDNEQTTLSGIRELEPRMTLRVRSADTPAETRRHQESQKITDWLRDVMGLKEADELVLLERAVIPRMEKHHARLADAQKERPGASILLRLSDDQVQQLWSDLDLAALVLHREAHFVEKDSRTGQENSRQRARFDALFERLDGCCLVPTVHEVGEKSAVRRPVSSFLGVPLVTPPMAELGEMLFGQKRQVMPSPGARQQDSLRALLERMGCFTGDLLVRVEVTDSRWPSDQEELPHSNWEMKIQTVELKPGLEARLRRLSPTCKARLFDLVAESPMESFCLLIGSTCNYFYHNQKASPVKGSLALHQLRPYLRLLNGDRQPAEPEKLALPTEKSREVLAELPELLAAPEAVAFDQAMLLAAALGARESVDWTWFTERAAERMRECVQSQSKHNSWSYFARWCRAAERLATETKGACPDYPRIRKWLEDNTLMPWESKEGAIGLFPLQQFEENEIREMAEPVGLVPFFQNLGALPAPEPKGALERWRRCAAQLDRPDWTDLQALVQQYESDTDGFQHEWKRDTDLVWTWGWTVPAEACTGVPAEWHNPLEPNDEAFCRLLFAWDPWLSDTDVPAGKSADWRRRLRSFYLAVGVRLLQSDLLRLADGIEVRPLASPLQNAFEQVRPNCPTLRRLLPAALAGVVVSPPHAPAVTWRGYGEIEVDLPAPREVVVADGVLVTSLPGFSDEALLRRFLTEQGLTNEIIALNHYLQQQMTADEGDGTSGEDDESVPDQAQASIQAWRDNLRSHRRSGSGQPLNRPAPPDSTLLPASPEEAIERMREGAKKALNRDPARLSRFNISLQRVETKDARHRSEAIRQELLQWYRGSCQHCGTIILKGDGKPYFEDTRLFKTGASKNLDNAHNRILLCPNCAARMNHNDWSFPTQAFPPIDPACPDRARDPWIADPHWGAAGGYYKVQFNVAGEEWPLSFHRDHYDQICVAFAEYGI